MPIRTASQIPRSVITPQSVYLNRRKFLKSTLISCVAAANPIENDTHDTGDWTLIFIVLTLSITPARKLLARPQVIRFRRMLGLFAFFSYHERMQECPDFLVITLKEVEGGIYGRVTDEEGKPVSRFMAALWNLSQESTFPRFGRIFDNDEGLFSITPVPAGVYRMQVIRIADPTTWSPIKSKLEKAYTLARFWRG
jgi:hypothetical protein